MRNLARAIKTAIGIIAGAICGGFLGSFGLFYLLSLIDWTRDGGLGNQIIGGAWILTFFTVPIGALVLGVACGSATWKSFGESTSEDHSDYQERESEQSKTW